MNISQCPHTAVESLFAPGGFCLEDAAMREPSEMFLSLSALASAAAAKATSPQVKEIYEQIAADLKKAAEEVRNGK
jgi:hypothetical protein